jgi:membrane-associated phospholipid phosphatase
LEETPRNGIHVSVVDLGAVDAPVLTHHFDKVRQRTTVLNWLRWKCRSPLLLTALLTLGGCASLGMDLPLARFCLADGLPGEVRAVFGRGELFGHGYGLIGIAVTIYLLDPGRRNQLPRLITAFVSAGLLANLAKIQFWRMRPRYYFEMGQEGSTFVGSFWTGGSIDWATLRSNADHSFPSAHMACAVALALGLSRLYPAGRIWFWILAVLCGLNRIDGGAHFASDVWWGAALGYAVATLVHAYHPQPLPTTIDPMERPRGRGINSLRPLVPKPT